MVQVKNKNRSRQEINLLDKVNDFKNRVGGPITIEFSNSGGALAGGQLIGVTNFLENSQGDKSAADIIAINSAGEQFNISCKMYNPGNFCGQGLKSFTEENKVMNMWMNQVLGTVGAYYQSITEKELEKAIDYVLNIIRSKPLNSKLTAIETQTIGRQWKKAKGITLPNVYIPIPKGMRKRLFESKDIYTGENVTHYITGGAAANPVEDLKTGTIKFGDCELMTTEELATESGMIYIVVRKRRADQFLELVDQNGSPVKDTQKFLTIYAAGPRGGSGRRIQVREQRQLPAKLRNAIFSDNGQKTSVPGRGSDALILDVPLTAVLNAVAAARYNNK